MLELEALILELATVDGLATRAVSLGKVTTLVPAPPQGECHNRGNMMYADGAEKRQFPTWIMNFGITR